MPVTITKDPDANIVIATYSDPFRDSDVEQVMIETSKYYDPNGEMLYSVSDASQLHLTFSDLVVALAKATRSEGWRVGAPNSVTIFVGNDEMVRMGREALKRPQYGGVEVHLFNDIDEALGWVREQVQR
ncbi:MAG: hypothetical protein CUN55_16180 [Phototrophicales bacterium]|nr:MAG: hypothetical protein CUN55_16180 [Phototrophicales bacterium]